MSFKNSRSLSEDWAVDIEQFQVKEIKATAAAKK